MTDLTELLEQGAARPRSPFDEDDLRRRARRQRRARAAGTGVLVLLLAVPAVAAALTLPGEPDVRFADPPTAASAPSVPSDAPSSPLSPPAASATPDDDAGAATSEELSGLEPYEPPDPLAVPALPGVHELPACQSPDIEDVLTRAAAIRIGPLGVGIPPEEDATVEPAEGRDVFRTTPMPVTPPPDAACLGTGRKGSADAWLLEDQQGGVIAWGVSVPQPGDAFPGFGFDGYAGGELHSGEMMGGAVTEGALIGVVEHYGITLERRLHWSHLPSGEDAAPEGTAQRTQAEMDRLALSPDGELGGHGDRWVPRLIPAGFEPCAFVVGPGPRLRARFCDDGDVPVQVNLAFEPLGVEGGTPGGPPAGVHELGLPLPHAHWIDDTPVGTARISGPDDLTEQQLEAVLRSMPLFTNPQPDPDRPATHVVQEGDTLYKIAEQAYGDGQKFSAIAEANGLSRDPLMVGQVLYLP